MKKILITISLLSAFTFIGCGNWFDWMHKDGTGDAESILIDAQMAYERGDYDTAYEYYSNCIDKFKDYDQADVYYKDGGDDTAKTKFLDDYWAKHNDAGNNNLLMKAYSGRATTVIKKVLSLKTIIEIAINMTDKDKQKENASKPFIESIFDAEDGCHNNVSKCYERAKEVYWAIAPRMRNNSGNFILPLDPKTSQTSTRKSAGEDLYRASKYSIQLGDYSQAIDYNLNFTLASAITVVFNILDTNQDGIFWNTEKEYPQVEDAIQVFGDFKVNIKAKDFYYVCNGGTTTYKDGALTCESGYKAIQRYKNPPCIPDPDNNTQCVKDSSGNLPLYLDLVNSLQNQYKNGGALPTNLASAQTLQTQLKTLTKVISGLEGFSVSLSSILNYTVYSFNDIILKYVGLDYKTTVNNVTYPDTATYAIYTKDAQAKYSSMKSLITGYYYDIFCLDDAYNENKLANGRTDSNNKMVTDSKKYATLYAINKAVDDFVSVKAMLNSLTAVNDTLISFYSKGYSTVATIDQLLAQDPTALQTTVNNMSQEDIDAIYAVLSNSDTSLFGSDASNSINVDKMDACSKYQIEKSICNSPKKPSDATCPAVCPSGCNP